MHPNRPSRLSHTRAGIGALRTLAADAGLVPPGAGGRGGVVLAYHDIGDDPGVTTDYYLSATLLRRHLRIVSAAGLRFVPVQELTARLLGGLAVDGLAAVVFDDALAGVHHHAVPVLADLGVPATLFVVTGCLGRTPPWWEGAGRTMTRAEVAECSEGGLTLAAHSRTHRSLPGCAPAELAEEVAGVRRELEDLGGGAVPVFAYPFGHHDPAVRTAVADAGYEAAYTFLNGRLQPGLDLFRLPRLTMSGRQDRFRLAHQLARAPDAWPFHQHDEVVARHSS